MHSLRYLPLLFLVLVCSVSSYGQTTNDSIQITVKPHVGLRGQLAAYNNQLEVQDNASRFGAELHIKKSNISFIAGTEIQLNLFKGNTSFNAEGSVSSGFLTIQSEQNQQVFANRLGYIGIDMGTYGKLTIGKQWSVYRDVTSYTDKFNVFGAKASATFVAGTDGGANGTGRADQSMIYRNKIGRFHLGTQLQLRGGNNKKFLDGFGISATFEFNDNISIGSAYNRAFISNNLLNSNAILGLNGPPTYLALAIKYQGDHIFLSATGVLQENGDFSQGFFKNSEMSPANPTIVFNAKGIEIFTKYQWNPFSLLIGYNLYLPSVSEQVPLFTKFKRNDVIAGLTYQPFNYVQFYCEQRISMGKTAWGEKEHSVFALGMKIDVADSFIRKVRL